MANNLDICVTESCLSRSGKKTSVKSLAFTDPEKQGTQQNYSWCCNMHHSISKATFLIFKGHLYVLTIEVARSRIIYDLHSGELRKF